MAISDFLRTMTGLVATRPTVNNSAEVPSERSGNGTQQGAEALRKASEQVAATLQALQAAETELAAANDGLNDAQYVAALADNKVYNLANPATMLGKIAAKAWRKSKKLTKATTGAAEATASLLARPNQKVTNK